MIGFGNIIPDLKMGVASLYAHKLRSLLTMLGMIFGVGAVVAMLSITEGAQKQMMSFHRPTGRQQYHRGIARSDGSQRRCKPCAPFPRG